MASAGFEERRLNDEILYILIALAMAVGAVAGYFVAFAISKRRIAAVERRADDKVHAASVEREKAVQRYRDAREVAKAMRSQAEDALAQRATAVEKLTVMARNVKALRSERAATKEKIKTLQNSLTAVHQRTLSLQREFEKAGQFYKRELQKSFRKRQQLDVALKKARADQDAFEKRIKESVLEHGSPEEMVTAAQLRFGQIEMLERAVDRLEAENNDLKEEIRQRKQDYEALRKDLNEIDELRINNQQLVRAVEALEQSRQQHEHDAQKAQSKANASEQLSETLRMRLSNLEESFAAIEQDQEQAIRQMKQAAPGLAANQAVDGSAIVKLAEVSNRR
jgi:chromosome segregation ATPase